MAYIVSKYLLTMGVMNTETTIPSQWDATQTAILDATLACIVEYGFAGLTTRKIAEKAGVNEVTLFRRFGNKAGVLRAAFEREAGVIQSEAIVYTGDVAADLTRIVAALWLAARRNATLPHLIMELPRNPELRDAAGPSVEAIRHLLALVERYQREGRLRSEPPLVTFTALVGPVVFTTLVGHMLPQAEDTFSPEAHVSAFLEGRAVRYDTGR